MEPVVPFREQASGAPGFQGGQRGVAGSTGRTGPISRSGTILPPIRPRVSRTLLRARRYPRVAAPPPHLRIVLHGTVAAVLLAFTLLGARFPAGTAPSTPTLLAASFTLPGLAASAPTTAVTRLESAAVPLTVSSMSVRQDATNRATSDSAVISASGGGAGLEATPGASSETVAASRVQEQLPLFYRYAIQNGDTVSGIATRFGIDSQYILWNNIDIISDRHLLTVGKNLQIPSVEGIVHQVKVGETISDIAVLYDAKASDVIGFPPNNLANNPNLLVEGSTIVVPGGVVVPKPAPSLRPQLAAAAPAAPSAPAPSALIAGRPQSPAGFIWPVVGNVTSFYGPSHPLGIDIEAPYVPVVVARAGQVVFAGGDPCCSYGLQVIVRHDGGYETRYAHLSQIGVKLGQWMDAGGVVGVSGATGNSTGAHLHFEVILNGLIQNPMAILP